MHLYFVPFLYFSSILTMFTTVSGRDEKNDSAIWAEVFKNSEVDPNIPKDKYGFSMQSPVGKNLDDKSQKFMLEVANDQYRDQYIQVEKELAKETKQRLDAFRKRMNKTAEIMNNRAQDAKQIAQSLIEVYKKDFNKIKVETEDKLKDYLEPLIERYNSWVKYITDGKPAYETKKNETLTIIQHKLEKHINENIAD